MQLRAFYKRAATSMGIIVFVDFTVSAVIVKVAVNQSPIVWLTTKACGNNFFHKSMLQLYASYGCMNADL